VRVACACASRKPRLAERGPHPSKIASLRFAHLQPLPRTSFVFGHHRVTAFAPKAAHEYDPLPGVTAQAYGLPLGGLER